ncbi:MAG: homing endonuclease associated repeat-containing protein [Bdellovibrionales bacterium]
MKLKKTKSSAPTKEAILSAIRGCAKKIGHSPSRSEFVANARISEFHVLKHFSSWREAVQAAGLEVYTQNIRIDDTELLSDWGEYVRKHRHIPTRNQYRHEGKYSTGSFDKHFGPWAVIPEKFKTFFAGDTSWADVLALIPTKTKAIQSRSSSVPLQNSKGTLNKSRTQHTKLIDRPTYGNPMDFRGLRHEPVNEGGVVFLFGIVARELGYLVEIVQAGFPDCEAKRQIGPGKWQRVRIEFEFESRNFRDHGHPPEGCDLIVCWRHNWTDCPPNLEVVELSTLISTLSSTDE